MAIQTAYPSTTPVGRPGMLADMRNRTVVSKTLQSALVPFGAPVMRGATDTACLAVGATGAGGYLGIAVMDATVRPGNGDAYVLSDVAGVMLKGIVWVTAAAACTPGQPAYFDTSGNLTNVSGGNTAIPGATFETTAAAGGLAQLRLA